MLFYGKTDIGQRRAANQDNFMIHRYSEDVLFAVVCDGMGGASGGNIASSVAAAAFGSVLDRREQENASFFGMTDEEILDLLSEAVTEANREVYHYAQNDPTLTGMGTTLVGCVVVGERVCVVNVGDSRLYAVEDGAIRQISHDHSYVQCLVDMGQLTAEEAKHSNKKNIIMRAVGTNKTVDADFFICRVKAGSALILCSDGLTNHVEPEEIAERVGTIRQPGDIQTACEDLIDRANVRGGLDNITAVILTV